MSEFEWWQEAVFYQIYPRSFADGNGDGIGDFAGMVEKLNYLQDLGIDAIWLSPHFPSPQADCGYDVSDYAGVAPEYGTLEEFKAFLDGAHERGIRVILDLVLNHTSDQHPWFLESGASRDNPKRDWYVWRDGTVTADGRRLPPNNWESTFTGSAWEYDPGTDQYYYHYFLKEQPDLNWRNPEVKAALWDAVCFWMDMGVDGFRLDAIATIFEHPEMPDHQSHMSLMDLYGAWKRARTPEDHKALRENWDEHFGYQVNQPGLHGLMKELRRVVDAYPSPVLVAENDDPAYMGNGNDELHLVFNFPLMRTDRLTPDHIRRNQAERLVALPEGGWPCNTLGNHDGPRVWTRFGDGAHDRQLAQLSLAVLMTLKGTPFLYYGEEIGMPSRFLDDIAQFRDTLALRQYDMLVSHGVPEDMAFKIVRQVTRDVCRTPMQWSAAPNAGFSPAGVETWLPVHENCADGVNVSDQTGDPASMLSFYKAMIRLRKATPALRRGEYTPLLETCADCLCFLRTTQDQRCVVVLNFSDASHTLDLGLDAAPSRLLFSSGSLVRAGDLRALQITPYEIYVAELSLD